MSKLFFPIVALLALTCISVSAENVHARGVHFSNGRVHVDVGNPHAYRSYGRYYRHNRHRTHYTPRYYPQIRGAHVWHNTGHYDWHPTEFRSHNGHIHISPGHYDWHQEGHIDHFHR